MHKLKSSGIGPRFVILVGVTNATPVNAYVLSLSTYAPFTLLRLLHFPPQCLSLTQLGPLQHICGNVLLAHSDQIRHLLLHHLVPHHPVNPLRFPDLALDNQLLRSCALWAVEGWRAAQAGTGEQVGGLSLGVAGHGDTEISAEEEGKSVWLIAAMAR